MMSDEERTGRDVLANQELDQAIASMVDLIPRGAWGLYQGFLEQGFSETQAMRLVGEFVHRITPGAERG